MIISDIVCLIQGGISNPGDISADTYSPFVHESHAKLNDSRVDIRIIFSNNVDLLPTGNMTKLFDNAGDWRVYQALDYIYVYLRRSFFTDFFCVARCNPSFTAIDLIFNDQVNLDENIERQVGPIYPIPYPLDQVLLTNYMARHNNGLLVHSAGIGFNGNGYIFPGKSGRGKSTLMSLFSERDQFELLGDDRIVVRKMADEFRMYGTPWPSDAGVANNLSAPLTALYFIHQASENKIEEVSPKVAVNRLLPVSFIPWYDREAVINLLDFCDDLTSTVPAFDLYFKPTTEVADFFQSVTLS